MPTTIKLKNSVTTTNAPSSLAQGEVAINITDKKVWVGNAATTPIQLLGDGGSVTFTSLTVTGVSTFSAGTVSAPSITTSGDTNTGIFFPAADTIGFTEGGVEALRLNANGQTSTSIAGTASLPSFTRTGDENTGIFFPAADTIAFTEGGVESMRIDSSGNLGLGVTSPSSRLDVNGVSTWRSGGTVRGYFGDVDTSNNIQIRAENALEIKTGGNNERMRIDSSGNVGIGTSSPASFGKLAVNGNLGITAGQFAYFYNSANSNYSAIACVDTTGMAFSTATTERMRITSGGDVGIGTSSPTLNTNGTVLHINNSTASRAAIIHMTNAESGSAAADGLIVGKWSDGINYFFDYDTNPLVFGTSGAERMRITSGGELLVGTTNNSATAGVGMKFLFTDPSSPVIKNVVQDGSGTYSSYNLYSTNAGAYRFYVTTAGVINATTTTITGISDERLKENIRDLDTGLNEIMAVKPRKFDWKEGKGANKKNDVGFIAQEFELVFPNSVSTSLAGEDGIEYKNINHGELIPTLVKAIQEQQQIINDLKARIETLESK